MTDFTPQSSNLINTSNVRENRDVYSGVYDTTGDVLPALGSGYGKTFTIITTTSVGLENSVIDADVWLREITDAGGGVSQYNHYKLPFSGYYGGSTTYQTAYHNVYYQADTPKGPESAFVGAVTLSIFYFNSFTSTQYPVFYYKITNRGVLA